jgi:23S rRNA (uracil1939-C5)-methyltransferase
MIETSYPETLHKKRKRVGKLFAGHEVEMVWGMDDPYHYRHKVYATFHSDRKNGLFSGLYEEGSHRLIRIDDCLIQNETANALIRDFTEIARSMKLTAFHEDTGSGTLRHLYIRVSHDSGKVLLVIVIGSRSLPGSRKLVSSLLAMHPEIESIVLNFNPSKTSMVLGERETVLYGKGFISDRIASCVFRISSRSFYQVNPVQTEVLYQTAIDLADVHEEDEVLDLCCGIGTISLLAREKAKHVSGVEIVPSAVRDAIYNAKANHIRNVSFFCEDIAAYLSRCRRRPDIVIADPARNGLREKACHALGKLSPDRIVYVSCNPETQASDCGILEQYGYAIQKIIPVDMFCFTDHVECVVLMTKQ